MKKMIVSDSVFIIVLLCMSALSGIASDMYIAAFPSMASFYHVPSTAIKWTVSLFFIGLAASQLIYGPMSDYIGRKKIMVVGFIIFFAGCLLCLSSGNRFWILICGRCVQGIGAGAMTCISRAILRDKFTGIRLTKALSIIGMGLAIVPAIAPLIGGYIQAIAGWKLEFLAMLLFSLLLFIIAFFVIPETNAYKFETKKSIRYILFEYKNTLIDPIFFINICIASFYISLIYVFYIMSSFYLQSHLHWNVIEYSRIPFIIAVALFSGRKFNIIFSNSFTNNQIILIGNSLALVAASVMLIAPVLQFNVFISLLLPIAIYALSAGLVFSNTFVGATERYTKTIGLVSSLYGFSQMAIVFAFISLSTVMKISSIEALGFLLFGTSSISIFLVLHLIKISKEEYLTNADLIEDAP